MAKASCFSTMISPVAGMWTNPTQAPRATATSRVHRHDLICTSDGTAISGPGYTTMTTSRQSSYRLMFAPFYNALPTGTLLVPQHESTLRPDCRRYGPLDVGVNSLRQFEEVNTRQTAGMQ